MSHDPPRPILRGMYVTLLSPANQERAGLHENGLNCMNIYVEENNLGRIYDTHAIRTAQVTPLNMRSIVDSGNIYI